MRKKLTIFSIVIAMIIASLIAVLIISGAFDKTEVSKTKNIAFDENAKAEEVEELLEIHEGGNCTEKYGKLMLINPNFRVSIGWIDNRRSGLISLSKMYGIQEGHSWNGDNLIDAEAAEHLNEMVKAYEAYNE
ncbi:hypothetical protein J6X90_03180, partial [Candidatus Saccharibacteria bacterium]|nr:hypothetical protein [Candidatus Saccharibacteria bacterium]